MPYRTSLRNRRWFSIIDKQLHNWMKFTGDRQQLGRRGKTLRRLHHSHRIEASRTVDGQNSGETPLMWGTEGARRVNTR